ncbi:MAG TPA: hypothetical protein VFM02_03740, partial [Candidatus Paceibacterota bacterium]|nr:hypothetical protein [Candidatus Paceibacterota bacterium]
ATSPNDPYGNTILASSIQSVTGSWSISPSGTLVVNELKVREGAEFGTETKPTSSDFTLYDKKTGAPYCVKISGGGVKTVPGKCSS